jgi:protein N-terminal methyltransferase
MSEGEKALFEDSNSPSKADSNISPAQSLEYWASVESDVNGMLGGFPQVSKVDILSSKSFLIKLRSFMKVPETGELPIERRGVDCGAGIGRITKSLLVKQCTTVDIVEPVSKFTDALVAEPGVGTIYNLGLENWTPEPNSYWLIWNQWCLGHLTDSSLVSYLRRCAAGLTQSGMIIVKENIVRNINDEDLYDSTDSSVTRTDNNFRSIFDKAGLDVVRTELQRNFPKELLAVRMYALRPIPQTQPKVSSPGLE